MLCSVRGYTGSRICDELALMLEATDASAGSVVFESLKQRMAGVNGVVRLPYVDNRNYRA